MLNHNICLLSNSQTNYRLMLQTYFFFITFPQDSCDHFLQTEQVSHGSSMRGSSVSPYVYPQLWHSVLSRLLPDTFLTFGVLQARLLAMLRAVSLAITLSVALATTEVTTCGGVSMETVEILGTALLAIRSSVPLVIMEWTSNWGELTETVKIPATPEVDELLVVVCCNSC